VDNIGGAPPDLAKSQLLKNIVVDQVTKFVTVAVRKPVGVSKGESDLRSKLLKLKNVTRQIGILASVEI
jgi:hypothetical protein